MKSFLKEFKEFAFKGNVLDLAVAVIIGAAFGTVISSLVNDVLMPLISTIFGATDTFASLHLGQIMYGRFINSVINFLIVAFSIFVVVKTFNAMKKEKAVEEVETPVVEASKEEKLLAEILEVLKSK